MVGGGEAVASTVKIDDGNTPAGKSPSNNCFPLLIASVLCCVDVVPNARRRNIQGCKVQREMTTRIFSNGPPSNLSKCVNSNIKDLMNM